MHYYGIETQDRYFTCGQSYALCSEKSTCYGTTLWFRVPTFTG
jgi:hypothetical protein